MKRIGLWVMLTVSAVLQASAEAPEATAREGRDVIEAVKEYQRGGEAPVLHRGEARKFPFGASTPVVSCAPLRVCVVRLQEGEEVFDVLAGDTARWMQFESRTGPGGATPILAFTPILEPDRTCDVTTNVVVTTSRRIYNFVLNVAECDRRERGDENPIREFDSVTEFYYPEDLLRRWEDQRAQAAQALARRATREPLRASSIDALHWGYGFRREGRKRFPWHPVVFDDGERTFLRMPPEAREVPGIFSKGGEELELVNWKRSANDPQQLIIEGVYQELVLTLPDGKRPRKLSILRESGDV
jgi:type IV secretion system protein TrbG